MTRERIIRGQRVDAVKLQRAKDMRRQMTPEEAMLWNALRTNNLHGHHFRRQQVIAGFIVDFYCHAARLVIEVDGPIHQQQGEYDAERDEIIAAHGLHILRFPNAEIRNNLPSVLARISGACQDATTG